MTPDPREDEVRARQRSRSLVMGALLLGFVVLIYFITIARMGG
jgi:hypothetical protein